MTDISPPQPALRAPASVLWLVGLILAAHLVFSLLGRSDRVDWLINFALFPARFLAPGTGDLPGGTLQGLFNLISFNFLHGGWDHAILNVIWLLAFGTPVARRLGTRRFLIAFFLGGAVGGLAQVMASGDDKLLVPIIGASAGVSAMIGAAARFAFPDTSWLSPSESAQRRRILSLRQTLSRRPVLVFIGIWFGLNLLFGLLGPLGFGAPDGRPISIAWIAHLGGFAGGLLLMGLVDRPPLSPSGGPGNVDYGDWYGDRAE